MKTNSWLVTLFSLLFIALPGIAIYFFAFPEVKKYLFKALIAFGFLFFCLLICFLAIFFHLLPLNLIAFAVPLAFVFFALLLSYDLEPWIVALITLPMILISIPCNSLVFKYQSKNIKPSKKTN